MCVLFGVLFMLIGECSIFLLLLITIDSVFAALKPTIHSSVTAQFAVCCLVENQPYPLDDIVGYVQGGIICIDPDV